MIRWILGLSLIVIGIVWACGGKMIIPPKDQGGDVYVETDSDGGPQRFEEEAVSDDSDVHYGDGMVNSSGSDDVVRIPGDSYALSFDNVRDGDSDEIEGGDNNCNESPGDTAAPSSVSDDCDDEHKAVVCHNGKSLCVDEHSVSAHLAKGDNLGKCK